MKLCGVEIPTDIEIPPLDPASKAELDKLHEAGIREQEEMSRRRQANKDDSAIPAKKNAPLTAHADDPLTFSINGLRQLSPWARARVLYVMREQVTD